MHTEADDLAVVGQIIGRRRDDSLECIREELSRRYFRRSGSPIHCQVVSRAPRHTPFLVRALSVLPTLERVNRLVGNIVGVIRGLLHTNQ